MARHLAVLLHRYAGLYIACYLSVIGLAGSLIAYFDEIDHALTPELHRVSSSGKPLDPTTLISQAEHLASKARVTDIVLKERLNDTTLVRMEPRIDPETNRPFKLDFTEIYLDPFSGEERGRRNFGDLSQGLKGLMPFIYRFHYSLALGETGTKLLGATALIWAFDCFVGFYLTLPPMRGDGQGRARRSWLSRWGLAWSIKFGGLVRTFFDIHRAAGLWVWLLLLIFAWSSVSFNLREEVYLPVMRSLLSFDSGHEFEAPNLDETMAAPFLDWAPALDRGRELMISLSAQHSFAIDAETWISLDRARNVYLYSVHSSLDISSSEGQTSVTFSAIDGSLLAFEPPTSFHSGNTFTNWLAALHKGKAFGQTYKAFICVVGLLITTLSLTGIFIWWKKRMARMAQIRRSSGRHLYKAPRQVVL
jgi:uncharacterized iron-regulated membrane protein